jgi:hypothetical protein
VFRLSEREGLILTAEMRIQITRKQNRSSRVWLPLIERAEWLNHGALGGTLGELIVQNHIEQRLMNPDAPVVFNKAVESMSFSVH